MLSFAGSARSGTCVAKGRSTGVRTRCRVAAGSRNTGCASTAFRGFIVAFCRSVLGSVAALCAFSIAAASPPRAGAWTLAAVAADVEAVVFADASGAMRKVAVGERTPDDAWRLSAIRDGRAVLKAERRLDGRIVEMHLTVGERLAPAPHESQPSRGDANTGNR